MAFYTSTQRLWTLIVLLSTAIVSVHAGWDARVQWQFPEPDKTEEYFLSDTINATYKTPYPDPRLGLFCYDTAKKPIKFLEQNGVTGYSSTLIPLERVNTTTIGCWLHIWERQPDGSDYAVAEDHGAPSAAFNVLLEKHAARTVGLPLPDAATVSSSSTSSSASSTGTPSNTSSTESQPEPTRISTGAIAGIAVGAAALVLGITVLAILFWRRRKTKAAMSKSSPAWMAVPQSESLATSSTPKDPEALLIRQKSPAELSPSNTKYAPLHQIQNAGSSPSPPCYVPLHENHLGTSGHPTASELGDTRAPTHHELSSGTVTHG